MRSGEVSWGAPDFGPVLLRPRLIGLIDSAGGRLRVISAPGGWGKSVLAAQWARSSEGAVLWLDSHAPECRVESIAQDLIAALSGDDDAPQVRALEGGFLEDALDAVRRAAASRVGERSGAVLVLDDLHLASESDIINLERLATALRGVRITCLITTRCRVAHSSSRMVLGAPELRLTAAEVTAVAAGRIDDASAREVSSTCGGHPALVDVAFSMGEGSPGRFDGGSPESRLGLLLRSLVDESMAGGGAPVLRVAAALGHGHVSELRAAGISANLAVIARIAQAVPLFALHEGPGVDDPLFRIHDLVQEGLWSDEKQGVSQLPAASLWTCAQLLAGRGDYDRAARLLTRFGDAEQSMLFLEEHASQRTISTHSEAFLRLAENAPAHRWIESPKRLLVLSRCMGEADWEGAAARARAAYSLARHEGDLATAETALALWLRYLGRGEHYVEAAAIVRQEARFETRSAELCVNACVTFACVGDFDAAGAELARLDGISATTSPATPAVLAAAELTRAAIHGMGKGDYRAMSDVLAPALMLGEDHLASRALLRGNLAFAMSEIGRTGRAIDLARAACDAAIPRLVATYRPVMGAAKVGRGDIEAGIEDIRQGIAVGISCRLDTDTAGNRLFESCVLRASGQLEASLTAAERAFEWLMRDPYMRIDRLASLEVAASLLALGDVSAARRWAAKVVAGGFDGNAYHALRAAMVLAECDRRDGDMESAVARLAEHRDHIVSESSNWQMAMYARAFPDLLGMLATAVGVDTLPIHMLRMVLPEYAERSLRAGKPWMQGATWRALGLRVMGESEFARLERRQGEPVCRVRMFGGLDVAVADRMIGERAWKKRKARLLFAMLVTRRGQDLPREQVLEYLWPDMTEDSARNNFYVVWSAMKTALMGASARSTPCPYVENTGGRCRIVRDAVRSDVDEFEETIAEARDAEAAGKPLDAIEAYSRLSVVYRGDLLPGDVYDDWFAPLRDRYRFDFVDAMMRGAQLLLAQDDPCEALVYLRRALQVDPLREDLYQVALRCHIAAGQRSGAIDTFLQCKSRLVDDLGLDPSAETMALYQEVLVMEDCPRYDDYGLS